ncbi:MAG: amidase, partial [Chloroflexota bacterium]
RMLPAAVGTDTGGSVRIPAACCGVVGLKPTYGAVSCDGIFPLAWSLDHAGILCRTVRDAGLFLGVMDEAPAGDYEAAAVPGALAGLRVGVPAGWVARATAGVSAAFEAALRHLAALGAVVREVSLPPPEQYALVNRAIAIPETTAWHEPTLRTMPEAYGTNIRPRMEAGFWLESLDYLTAQRLRARLCRQAAVLWEEVDLLASPTVPQPAPPFGVTEAPMILFTAYCNVLGLPAISVPCGPAEDDLPAGLQLAAPPRREVRLLRAAAAFEAAAGPWPLPPDRPPTTNGV